MVGLHGKVDRKYESDEGYGDYVDLSAMRQEFQDFGFPEEVLWGGVCEGV